MPLQLFAVAVVFGCFYGLHKVVTTHVHTQSRCNRAKSSHTMQFSFQLKNFFFMDFYSYGYQPKIEANRISYFASTSHWTYYIVRSCAKAKVRRGIAFIHL